VAIAVNGVAVAMNMKVGEAGEAFFVVEMDKDDAGPAAAEYATSPLLRTSQLFAPETEALDIERGKTPTPLPQAATDADKDSLADPAILLNSLPIEDRVAAINIAGTSSGVTDSLVTGSEIVSTTPTRRNQIQLNQQQMGGTSSSDIAVGSPGWQWNWGGLPVKKEGDSLGKQQQQTQEPLEVDVDSSAADTFEAAAAATLGGNDQSSQQLFPKEDSLLVHEKVPIPTKPTVASSLTAALREGKVPATSPTGGIVAPAGASVGPAVTVGEKMESYFSSLPEQMTSPDKPPSFRATSPSPLETHMNSRVNTLSPLQQSHLLNSQPQIINNSNGNGLPAIELSLCGKQALTNLIIAPPTSSASITPEQLFSQHQVTYESFIANPTALLANPDLVFRMQERYYDWTAVAPILVSAAAFGRGSTVSGGGGVSSPRQSQQEPQLDLQQPRVSGEDKSSSTISITEEPKKYSGFRGWWGGGSSSSSAPVPSASLPTQQKSPAVPEATPQPTITTATTNLPLSPGSITGDFGPRSLSPAPGSEIDGISTAQSLVEEERERSQAPGGPTRYIKSLRMTSEQLEALNLQPGVNTISFSVTSRLQGTATCTSKIFLWEHDTKVVISDVDGTITKSDVLGHVFTMVGQDWTHSGVASLYTNIRNNGYQILYLTSRAIGQANYTRDYLKKVEQGKFQLPEGPIVMSPDRLFAAFHREVIQRRPEEFKISCLRDIKRLFGPTAHPFYAGFGNRITDVQSYRAVDIPLSRIFTIDPSGDIKLEFTAGYKSSYGKLNEIVNHIFPPVVDGNSNSSSVGGGKGAAMSEEEFWEVWRQYLPEAVVDMTVEAKIESGVHVGSEEILAAQAQQVDAAVDAAAVASPSSARSPLPKKEKLGGGLGATVIEITANESGMVEVHSGEEEEEDDDDDEEEYEEASGSDVTDEDDDEDGDAATDALRQSEDDATLKKRMAEMKTFRY
ncbi:UNVERIFIED_CONTAM: hypothetical protein HDU68_005152, partial [Siphonaria sp. JEL0065]